MPELPEVETTKNGLSPYIVGQKVEHVDIIFPTLRYPIPTQIPSCITGQRLQDIRRRGKYLIFVFKEVQLIIHLGMSGKMTLSPHSTARIKHDHFEIRFADTTLRLNDYRRFGCVLVTTDYTQHPLIASLGVEPLKGELTAQYLWNKARGKSAGIKNFIMDSKYLVGVGNIYASESLFRAGIHPTTEAQKVSKIKMEKLVHSIKEVLSEAISQGGTTLKDFAGVTGKLGYFAISLNVYGREHEPCNVCATTIKKITQGQRSTFYCPSCQK